jgi:hypothetical protein
MDVHFVAAVYVATRTFAEGAGSQAFFTFRDTETTRYGGISNK